MTSPSTSAATRPVFLLGHPVAHSLSPRLHSAAFAAAGVDAVYVAADVAPDELPSAVAGLRALGALGANLTVPHKVAALGLVDRRTSEVDAVGAANTLFWDGDELAADNTDAAGLEGVLRDELHLRPGTRALVLGSGGAARAAAVALGRVGAAVAVRARRPEAGDRVAALARAHGAAGPFDGPPRVVVNATPLGLGGESLPDDLMRLGPGQVALDLLYGRTTPFLQAASDRGATAVDGLSMLVRQAAASFTRWTGAPAPLDAMRAAAWDVSTDGPGDLLRSRGGPRDAGGVPRRRGGE
ncbi:MAG: shikimate dehydrogenase [Euzebyales bacterium]|nr:shikimate dehydrogenase [Euzebyales bacterium]